MRGTRSGLAVLAVVLAIVAPFAPPTRVGAAVPYTLATNVSYAVKPDAHSVAVTVDFTFTNLTPDPAGAFSVYDDVPIAIHDGAVAVAARDATGVLHVGVKQQQGGDGASVNVATVTLRAPLRYNKTAKFTLTYALQDGKGPGIRIRPSVVSFPVWGYGTSSEVRVTLPSDFEVSSDGDPLTATRSGPVTTLGSGRIADPQHWLSLLIAGRQTTMVTVSQSVPLSGGTVDLNVRSFADDPGWGPRTLKLLVQALPQLQKRIGLPYAGVGPLVVSEALPSGAAPIGETSSSNQQLQVAFDAPPFTVLHQAAHIWIGSKVVRDRWIREGLASHYAALVAAQLKVATPYNPITQASTERDAAFPLDEWTDASDATQGAYGYPGSWELINDLLLKVGEDAGRQVLLRVSAGAEPYDPGTPAAEPAATPATVTPLDSRGLLDQLQQVTGRDLGDEFAARVFGDASAALVAQRAAARAAYGGLLAAAGDWGAPQPVRAAMTEWRFDDAMSEVGTARAWLGERDALLQAIAKAGLSSPDRLRDPYETSGGGTDAQVELRAERAVVDDYQAVLERATASRSFIERLGLLGGTSPDELLASAHGLFTDGDLRGAADATSQARLRLEAAGTAGLLRLASAAVVALIALAAAVYLFRRRRTLARNVD